MDLSASASVHPLTASQFGAHEAERAKHKQTDGQTDRRTNRETDRQTDIAIHRNRTRRPGELFTAAQLLHPLLAPLSRRSLEQSQMDSLSGDVEPTLIVAGGEFKRRMAEWPRGDLIDGRTKEGRRRHGRTDGLTERLTAFPHRSTLVYPPFRPPARARSCGLR